MKNRLYILATVAALYLLFATGLTLTERFFIKNDLNEMTASDCRALQSSRDYDLIVAPYPRTRMRSWSASRIPPSVPIVDTPLAHHYLLPDEQFASVMAFIRRAKRILFVSTPARGSSLDRTRTKEGDESPQNVHGRRTRWSAPTFTFAANCGIFERDQTRWQYRGEGWNCSGHPEDRRVIDGQTGPQN